MNSSSKHISNTDILRESVLEKFHNIDETFYRYGMTFESQLDELSSDIEKYISLNENSSDGIKNRQECEFFESRFRKLSERTAYFNRMGLLEGFDTWDLDDEDEEAQQKAADEAKARRAELTREKPPVQIQNVRAWNNNVPNKTVYRNGGMYAGKFFGPGDIIETSPVRYLQDGDLYSRTIRDFAFEVDRNKGLYAIPFGYATYYKSASDLGSANASYTFEMQNGKVPTIIIKALDSIKPNTEIIIVRDPNIFAVKDGKSNFDTNAGRQSVQAIKHVKFV